MNKQEVEAWKKGYLACLEWVEQAVRAAKFGQGSMIPAPKFVTVDEKVVYNKCILTFAHEAHRFPLGRSDDEGSPIIQACAGRNEDETAPNNLHTVVD